MAAGLIDGLTRRPQRLIILATIVLLFLTFTTWASYSPDSVDQVRSQLNGIYQAGKSKYGGFSGAKTSTGAAGGEDALYGFNPGAPQSYDEMLKWAQKGGDGNLYPPYYIPSKVNKSPRVKAAFVVLVRNGELGSMRESMREGEWIGRGELVRGHREGPDADDPYTMASHLVMLYTVELRFNRKYGYPWIFLNNEPFTEEFKTGVQGMTRSECKFGFVGKEHWGYPDYIDQNKAAETRVKMKDIIYGDNENYRHMCRFQSGFFFQHELTMEYDYYWRVEPGIKLYCDIDYDPFLFMQMNNKTYGFTMGLKEYEATIPTLWEETKKFAAKYPEHIAKDNSLGFLTADDSQGLAGSSYNLCHFWSNFEIGDLRFWRSKPYQDYFNHLDHAGGFFYERWGDAPVHSIAASLMLDKSRMHHFDDIGYFHNPWGHCPAGKQYRERGRCDCDPAKSFDRDPYSCLNQWFRIATEGDPLNFKGN